MKKLNIQKYEGVNLLMNNLTNYIERDILGNYKIHKLDVKNLYKYIQNGKKKLIKKLNNKKNWNLSFINIILWN